MTEIYDTIIIIPVAEVFCFVKASKRLPKFRCVPFGMYRGSYMRRNFDRLIKQRIKLHRKEFLL